MMYLGVRSDSPVAEFYLYEGTVRRAEHSWQADRQLAHGLLGQLERFLEQQQLTFEDLSGVFAYRGPGSFTGLRIGITVVNTIAYAQTIPVVGGEGDSWLEEAVGRLEHGDNDGMILPHYGAEARITSPKK